MGHLVRYSSPEGEERYEDVRDLDAAVERVEHLRNSQGVSDVRVYREVPLEFRTYVQVAVADEEGGSPSPDAAPGSTSSGAASEPGSGQASGPSSAATPSGAAVISPPPASARSSSEAEGQAREAEASAVPADAEARSAENRRISLFNRGQAS